MNIELEILKLAYNQEIVEIVEHKSPKLESVLWILLKDKYIVETEGNYNSIPYRDAHGLLHTFKHIRLTKKGLDMYKEIMKK